MRYLIFFSAILFLFSCKNETGNTGSAPAPQAKKEIQPPPEAPPLPANMSVDHLRAEIRDIIRMQLPNSHPVMRNGKEVLKGFSFDLEAYGNGQPLWVFQEKLYEKAVSKPFTAGKYLMLWANIDPNSIGYTFSEDGEQIGIVVRPLPRQSFIFHPFAQELQDEVVTEVVIGMYDRVQDATLARAVVAMKTLAANMDKWKDE